jgi:hypothetical protein
MISTFLRVTILILFMLLSHLDILQAILWLNQLRYHGVDKPTKSLESQVLLSGYSSTITISMFMILTLLLILMLFLWDMQVV